jgi:hypothetical protein
MGKWPLHLILHQKNSLSIPRPRLSASARASLPIPISRPFAVQNLLILNSGRDAHAPWGSRCNKDDSSKGPLGTKAPA